MRFFLRSLVGLILLLAIAWFGLWWYAEGRMQSGFASWADQVAVQGGQVSYDSLRRGTSPGTAAITLGNVRIALPPAAPGGRSAVLTLPSLGFRISMLRPLLLHVDLPNRLNVGFNDVDAVVSFGAVAQTEELDPHVLYGRGRAPLRSGDFAASDVDVLASGGSLLVLHMDAVRGDVRFDGRAGAAGVALDASFSADGLAPSPLVARLLSVPFGGRVAHLAYAVRLSGPVPADLPALASQFDSLPPGDLAARQKLLAPRLRAWAAAGGNGTLTAGLTVGPTAANFSGTVKFDANVQPEGTADLTANHLDQLTAALTDAYPGLQDTVARLEAELSPYLTSSDQGGQSLAVHAVYGAGAVTINGQKAGALPAVNWDALENPAPATPPG